MESDFFRLFKVGVVLGVVLAVVLLGAAKCTGVL